MITKTCDFCGNEIETGRGKMNVLASGSITIYCSSKCERNALKLKRKPRKVRWTSDYKKEKDIRVKLLKGGKSKEKKPKEQQPEAKAEKKVEEKKEEPKAKHKKVKKQKIKTKAPAKKVSLAKKKKK